MRPTTHTCAVTALALSAGTGFVDTDDFTTLVLALESGC